MKNFDTESKKRKKYKKRNDFSDDDDTASSDTHKTRTKRSCLMCGKMFNSKSAGNRRCHVCSRSSSTYSGGQVYMVKGCKTYLPDEYEYTDIKL